jgi:hypothetical protein
MSVVRPSSYACTIGKIHSDYGVGLELCPLCRFEEGELIDTNNEQFFSHPDKMLGIGIHLLMYLDTNTRSTKRGPSPATTMMLILLRTSENRACLHRISILVSGRRCPPMASLGLFSLRNSRPQRRSISFFVIGRWNDTGWRAGWRSWLMMTT